MISKSSKEAYLNTRLSLFASRLRDTTWFGQQVEKSTISSHALLEELHIPIDDEIDDKKILDGSLFLKTLQQEYLILLRPSTGFSRQLMVYWMKHLELRNLKTILRGILNKNPVEAIRKDLSDLGSLASLPFEELLRSDDVMELLRTLDKTSYAAMSRQARQLFEKHNDPFFVDASIDQRYFTDIASTIRLMDKADRLLLQHLFGSIIDQHNLLWLLRYRFTYGLRPAETWYLLMSGGLYLPSSQLLKLVGLETVDQVIESLPDKLAEILNGVQGIFEIDQRMDKLIVDTAWKMLRNRESTITRTMAWLILRERQLVRISALLKGRQLSLDPQLIRVGMGLEER